jgi:hypothetical protein
MAQPRPSAEDCFYVLPAIHTAELESPRQVDLTLRFSRRNVRYLHI